MYRKRMPAEKTALAQKMRMHPTDAERALLAALIRASSLSGLRWRSQYPTLGWIVDIYQVKHRIIVEVDGSIHDQQKEQDAFRDRVLMQRLGAIVIRVRNHVVLADPDGVAAQIIAIAKTRPVLHGSQSNNLPTGQRRIFLT